jgi:hypothetical protein
MRTIRPPGCARLSRSQERQVRNQRLRDVAFREAVRLRAPLRDALACGAVVFRALFVFRVRVLVLVVRRSTPPALRADVRTARTTSLIWGTSDSASTASSAAADIVFDPPSTWRCNDPMMRPSVSADRSNNDSLPDGCALRAGSTFVPRLAIPSSSLEVIALAADIIKVRASRPFFAASCDWVS